ncbi:MAG: Macrolide export ATP-binding/permease protein MacB [bacterium ADurb.Bin400]|nr:MAG: Macrolide export ATP-binding/permease protein MacB [bacterium ADurb.Bin400]
MKFIDIIRIAVANVKGNKTRSALTILGISVGIAAIVFLVSLGYGLQELSVNRIASIEAVNTVSVSTGKIAAPDKTFFDKWNEDPRIEKSIIVNSTPIQGLYNGTKIDGVASIVPSDYFGLEGIKPDTGNFYSKDDIGSIVISTGFLKGLNTSAANVIGQPLTIKIYIKNASNKNTDIIEETLKVMGIYLDDTTAATFVSPDLLEKTGELPINQVKLKVADRGQVLAVKNEIQNAGYSVSSVADTIGQLDSVFNIIQIILAVFGGIALVVASIGMFNTMTIALLERTRDVGVMKATGMEKSGIYLIFLSEAVIISALGGLFGIILGWLTTKIINMGVNTLAQSVGGEQVDLFSTPVTFVAIILGFSLFVGFSTGFLPARRASNLNPLEALRYE